MLRRSCQRLYTVREIVAWFADRYPKIKASSVRAHSKGLTANDPSRHHYPGVARMTALFVRQLDKSLLPFDAAAASVADADEDIDELDEDGVAAEEGLAGEQAAEFVLEAQLEEFLAGNWASIGWGRPLEIWSGPGGQSGHQLSTPAGRLDLLTSGLVQACRCAAARPDEAGFAPLDDTGAQLLFRLASAACERRALGVASHWPFDQRGRFLPGHTTAVSLLDRLLHHANVVVTDGDSCRMRQARARGNTPNRK